jgi:WD40 repeat protein
MLGLGGKSRAPRPFTKRWAAKIDGHVQAIAWSPDRLTLAVASADGPIILFDAATGQVRQTLEGHAGSTVALAWHPRDVGLLASAGQDGKIRLWKLGGEKPECQALVAGAAWAERVAWSNDGTYLASAAGKKLKLWSSAGELVREYPDHPSTILDIGWKPGSGNLLASAAYGKLQLWMPDKPEPVQKFEWKGSMLVLSWAPAGTYIATGDQDKTVHFWNLRTGDDLMMSGYPTKVREISWDASSRYLATGGGDMPCVWDCSGSGPEGTAPMQFKGHQNLIAAVAFMHRGPYLVTADKDGLLVLWQPGGSKTASARSTVEGPITQVVWATDDKHLAVGTETGTVVLLATPTL